MSSRIAGHLRSNIVGYVAVFIALSGTAYAVDGSLPGQDTVGSEDIINNDILSKDIADGRIFNVDLADNLITGQKMKDGTLTGADVLNQSLTGFDIGTNEINGDHVIDGAIRSPDVLDQSLTGSDVGDNTINSDDVFGLGSADIVNDSLLGSDVAVDTLGSEDVRQEGLRGEDIDEGTLDLDLERVTGLSDWDSSSPKTISAVCPSGKVPLGGGGWVNASSGVAHIEAIVPDLGLRRVQVTASESDATGEAWFVQAAAICARLAG